MRPAPALRFYRMASFPVSTRIFRLSESSAPFITRGGEALFALEIAYETYGTLNTDRSNAILVFHAMTGSQHAAGWNPSVPEAGGRWTEECYEGWWDSFIGEGKPIDTRRFFVICANVLGGCYGSTGPASTDPRTGRPYGAAFPQITIPDMVRAQLLLLDHLGIDRLHAAIGGSIGGLMVLDLAMRYPSRVARAVPIASGMEVTPLQRLHNFEQIAAIQNDRDFQGGNYYEARLPIAGLALARMIAHKTFVSLDMLKQRARNEIAPHAEFLGTYRIQDPHESYMLHQGTKFTKRFDANSYLRILEAWQSFVCPLFDPVAPVTDTAWTNIPFLIFTIDSDVCFYPEEQEKLARLLADRGAPCLRTTVHSDKGHDSFLLEPDLFAPHLHYFLNR